MNVAYMCAFHLQSQRARQELRGIATDPDSRNVFEAVDFSNLNNFTESIVQAVCNSTCNCTTVIYIRDVTRSCDVVFSLQR